MSSVKLCRSQPPTKTFQDFPAPSGSNLSYPSAVNVGCAAWSIGKDATVGSATFGAYYRYNGTASDDVVSWQ